MGMVGKLYSVRRKKGNSSIMKISLILPPSVDDWQGNIIRELVQLRHLILVNDCDGDADVIIGMSHTQWRNIKYLHEKYPKIPLITLNWDWYDYIDKTQDGWPEFTQLMRESVEVWTSSKAEADKCNKETGIESSVYLYAFIMPWEWKEDEVRDYGYVFQASRPDKNKRFDWFIRAAKENNIPYKAYYPKENSRKDYIRAMKNCSFWVLASREESIGGLGTMEASFCKKPILISDNAGSKEVWGKDATYFKRDEYDDFKKQMKWLWENRDSKEVKEKIDRACKKVEERFMPKNMAKLVNERLKVLFLNKAIR